jgi:hypothetical protein
LLKNRNFGSGRIENGFSRRPKNASYIGTSSASHSSQGVPEDDTQRAARFAAALTAPGNV